MGIGVRVARAERDAREDHRHAAGPRRVQQPPAVRQHGPEGPVRVGGRQPPLDDVVLEIDAQTCWPLTAPHPAPPRPPPPAAPAAPRRSSVAAVSTSCPPARRTTPYCAPAPSAD